MHKFQNPEPKRKTVASSVATAVCGCDKETTAFAFAPAAASIMARRVIGEDTSVLLAIAEAVRQMLKDGVAPSDDLWPELQMIAPAHEYKSRHGSVLLAFEAVEDAIQSISQGQEQAVG